MELGALKPWLVALAIPPGLGVLLIALTLLCLVLRKLKLATGLAIVTLCVGWFLSCTGFAVWLSTRIIPQVQHLAPAQAHRDLATARIEAIVVLGGGVELTNREYGVPQPASPTRERMEYALHLSRSSNLPIAFSGGIGWANAGQGISEAHSVNLWLQRQGQPLLRWQESRSRDTAENAHWIATQLQPLAPTGIARIALVTHAYHMPRAVLAFSQAGFHVLPAPIGFVEYAASSSLEWLPSAEGVRHNRNLLREAIALALGAY